MEIKQKVRVHNRFDIKVCNKDTGEVKQEAVAYNVVKDGYFKSRLGIRGRYELDCIFVGDGTGTPTTDDSGLFHELTYKRATTIETIYAYPTSHRTIQIKIESTELNGKNLTEVGIGSAETSGTIYKYWYSHAMIQDSEGHQIAIAKTDIDVVYITATFYVTWVNSGFGANGIYPPANKNDIVKFMLGANSFPTTYLFFSGQRLNESSDLSKKYSIKSGSYGSWTGDLATLTRNMQMLTVLDSEWKNHLMKTVGIPGIGAFTFPDSQAFSDYSIDHISIGSGDGATKEFNIKCPLIKEGTVRVYVGNVELSADDFEVDYESNCTECYDMYYTAGLESFNSENVVFGDFNTQTSTLNTVVDPTMYADRSGLERRSTGSVKVNAQYPIWFDLSEPKECNRLKITKSGAPALIIQCSDDNEQWDNVSFSLEGNNYNFEKTTARYWKIYPVSGNWNVSVMEARTLDQVNTGAFVFLGKVVPGLKLRNAPAEGQAIEASYKINVPYKTENNLLRFSMSIQMQRG